MPPVVAAREIALDHAPPGRGALLDLPRHRARVASAAGSLLPRGEARERLFAHGGPFLGVKAAFPLQRPDCLE
jgi:hypothetical protein